MDYVKELNEKSPISSLTGHLALRYPQQFVKGYIHGTT